MNTSPMLMQFRDAHLGGVARAELFGLLDPRDPLVLPNAAVISSLP
jgi:hypothetical protein